MKRWFTGCVILLALTGCATTAQQPAEEIYQHREALREMWPGYDPVARGVGYYNNSDGYVTIALETDTPPPQFTQLSPGVWRSDNAFPHLRRNFYVNTSIDDIRVTLVSYPSEDETPFTLLFHEDFHGHQEDNAAARSGNTLSRFDIGQMPINRLVAALRTERSLLIAALEADTSQRREQVLLHYAGLRLWREAQLPSSTVSIERDNETHEGTANWIGHRATQVLLGRSDSAFLEGRKQLLEHDYEALNASTALRLATMRVYATGAALTQLLPQVTELEWQGIVEQESATLFEMLLRAFEWPQNALDTAGEEITASQEFAHAIDKAAQLTWPESDEVVLARVESQHRWKLSIDLPAGADGGFSAVGGTVTQVTDNMLLLHPVQQYDVENEDLSVAIRNQNIALHNSSMLSTLDDEGDGEQRQQVLTIYLNQIDNSLRCADEEQACNGSLVGLEQRGVRIQSEIPLSYQLERMHR